MVDETEIHHYLLIRDRRAGKMIREPQDFGTDDVSALRAYEVAEDRYRDRPEIDVLLVGSDSLETVRRTHASYFAERSDVTALLDRLRRSLTGAQGAAKLA